MSFDNELTKRAIAYGVRVAGDLFTRRSRSQRNVEVHLSETDLASLVAIAWEAGYRSGRSAPRFDPTQLWIAIGLNAATELGAPRMYPRPGIADPNYVRDDPTILEFLRVARDINEAGMSLRHMAWSSP